MSFDALTMHAVRDELEATIQGGFIEKVVPLSDLEVGLRIRARHRDFNLVLSADARSGRVHLVSGTLRRLSEDVTPFLLLMRKYVREGRIISIDQPPLERVMRLGVENRQEDGSILASQLIIEVMGRHSNVILVNADGEVLDAIKRIPPSMSRLRPVLPHMTYELPPAVDKLDPLSPTLGRQLSAAASQMPPATAAWRFIQEAVAGLGPLSAREVTHRACGDAGCTLDQIESWDHLARELRLLFGPIESHQWSPCVVVQDNAIIHFAPFRLTQYPAEMIQETEGISRAVERAHAERIQTRPGEALRVPLRASVQAKLERVVRREDSLKQALTRGEKAEELKLTGQAILASTGSIEPGQKELAWEQKAIVLDPKLSAAENAQRYFREYAKSRDAAKEIPALLEAVRLEREYLEQVAALIEIGEDEATLRTISREISESPAGPIGSRELNSGTRSKSRTGKPGKGKPEPPAGAVRRYTTVDGSQVLVGGSARGNERATFELATGSDLWFHVRGIPGAHVILKTGGQEPSRKTLLEAARLAAIHSQARNSTKVAVDYAPRRYVKKVKGGPPGLVTYTQEQTVRVDATEPGASRESD